MSTSAFIRANQRLANQLRPIQIELGVQSHAAGSALIRWGNTHVLCSASIENTVPQHQLGKGGWISAEYALLPNSTLTRSKRERPHVSGRTAEIQRLIGRSLRSVVDLKALGDRTLWVDCDVIQADGGTRCAAITGSYIAVCQALRKIQCPEPSPICAVSVGLMGSEILLDLDYVEDSHADVDLTYVQSQSGLSEVHAGAEGHLFSRSDLNRMLDLAEEGCKSLFMIQKTTLENLP